MTCNLILYHASCYDGFGAAYAAWKYFGDKAEYIPMYYNDPLPSICEQDHVFLLDYSRKAPDLIKLLNTGAKVEIHDHHESAISEVEKASESADNGFEKAVMNVEKSGAVLAWERFHPHTTVPTILKHIQDRDLWKFELKGTKEIHAYLCSLPFNFQIWDETINRLVEGEDIYGWHSDYIEKGRLILRYQNLLVDQFCENAQMKDIAGHKVPVANISMLFSEVPHKLLELYPDAPFAAYRYYRKSGVIQYGLRGRGDFDVSEVAKKFGGGGHFSAAGYEVKE